MCNARVSEHSQVNICN